MSCAKSFRKEENGPLWGYGEEPEVEKGVGDGTSPNFDGGYALVALKKSSRSFSVLENVWGSPKKSMTFNSSAYSDLTD